MDLQVLCDQAIALHQRGDTIQAEPLYRQVLSQDPSNFTANYFLGVMRFQQGRATDALLLIAVALKANPSAADAYTMQGLCLQTLKHFEQALASYDRALVVQPDNMAALINRGAVLRSSGKLAESLASYDRALKINPVFFDALTNRGAVLRDLGRPRDALHNFDAALSLQPSAAAWFNRGTALQDLGRLDEAVDNYDKALALNPGLAAALYSKGTSLLMLNQRQKALECFERVLAIQPSHFEALHKRGGVLRDLGNLAEALASFSQAIVANPKLVDAHLDRGNILRAMGRSREAVEDYDRALALDPNNAVIRFNRAAVLLERGQLRDAIAGYEETLTIQPDFPYALGDLFQARMQAGDWRGFEKQIVAINAGVHAGDKTVLPFVYEAITGSPADLLACSVIYGKDRYPLSQAPARPLRPRTSKIRIGYVCGEFREHATGYLTAGLFEKHDRDRFDIRAFDNGWDDKSPIRKRLEAAFDGFVDIASMSDEAAAKKIAAEQVDILVNLNGYCGLGRMGVFARKPAPVQVNYLGFPGTLGVNYIDYILADRFVIPESERHCYTEHVVYLPDSYWVNDNYCPLAVAVPDRTNEGLADATFVFCNFNQSYKITPPIFALWMEILTAIPRSVLWLLETNRDFAENMKHQAEKHGVTPNRLVFAKPLPREQHLARLSLADLFLDTLPYNAHTTATDALRAGVPLLTCRGTSFVGRVATSLLHAIGLPELVTENLESYQALALRLAHDSTLLRALRDKLSHNRSRTALFDTDRFRRHIEGAYTTMMEMNRNGEEPRSFAVAEI